MKWSIGGTGGPPALSCCHNTLSPCLPSANFFLSCAGLSASFTLMEDLAFFGRNPSILFSAFCASTAVSNRTKPHRLLSPFLFFKTRHSKSEPKESKCLPRSTLDHFFGRLLTNK